MERVTNNLKIENARLVFRNFAGKERKFNPAGKRSFCVRLDPDTAEQLRKEGWNVQIREPREEGEDPRCHLEVSVNFGGIPPRIFMLTSQTKVQLDENTVGALDTAELENVDLVIRPYNWEVNGKTGVKAYLKTLYATIVEDEFESKYNMKKYGDMAAAEIDDGDMPF